MSLPDDLVVTIRAADLLALNQISREVLELVAAIGQGEVNDRAAQMAGRGLALAALRRMHVVMGNAGPVHRVG
jgi:hypothetical protein